MVDNKEASVSAEAIMDTTNGLAFKHKDTIINIDQQVFFKYIVSITEDFQLPTPLVVQGDKILVSRGNLATIIGKPKAFKTFLNSAIISGFLEDTTLSLSGTGGKCLHIDTEQSKAHCNVVQRRIYKLCGWNLHQINPSLIMLSLRELNAEDRLKTTLEAISALHPDLVIIDGIRDLVKDFNDLKESAEIVGLLMKVSTQVNCGIISVLHQNKSDNNARGHLGSELCNKAETVLQVVKEGCIATVSPVYSRNFEIDKFSFRIDSDGLPVGCDLPKIEKKNEELSELMRKAMFGSSSLCRKELIEKVVTIEGKTERTANRKVKDALEKGLLQINHSGFFILGNNIDNEETILF